MILLLDANALVGWLANDPALTRAARAAIADPANQVLVSAATVWELAFKQARGKITLVADLAAAVDEAGFSGLPVTLSDGQEAASLPPHHRDPFDRMVIAQAIRVDALVVTRDRAFAAYDVRVLPA